MLASSSVFLSKNSLDQWLLALVPLASLSLKEESCSLVADVLVFFFFVKIVENCFAHLRPPQGGDSCPLTLAAQESSHTAKEGFEPNVASAVGFYHFFAPYHRVL